MRRDDEVWVQRLLEWPASAAFRTTDRKPVSEENPNVDCLAFHSARKRWEVTFAHVVREFPEIYPWWMAIPDAPKEPEPESCLNFGALQSALTAAYSRAEPGATLRASISGLVGEFGVMAVQIPARDTPRDKQKVTLKLTVIAGK